MLPIDGLTDFGILGRTAETTKGLNSKLGVKSCFLLWSLAVVQQMAWRLTHLRMGFEPESLQRKLSGVGRVEREGSGDYRTLTGCGGGRKRSWGSPVPRVIC